MKAQANSSDFLANYFVQYLIENYHGTRHVRRVAAWVGFIIKGIERLPGATPKRRRSRQLEFDYAGRLFKVRYQHDLARRGGIVVVEVLLGRGAPEGGQVASISNLNEAEHVYHCLHRRLKKFIAKNP